jgi:putative flippase GtrA
LSVIRDTYARFRVLIHEVGKFGLVGIASTILTLAIENALHGHMGTTTEVVIANAIATCFAYVGNRYWAFKHRKNANMGRETVLFVFFNVVGTLIQAGFVDFDSDLLHNHDRFSFNVFSVIGIGVATLFRLYCYRKFVFTAAPPAVPAEELTEPVTIP